jgi:hypothetical protein
MANHKFGSNADFSANIIGNGASGNFIQRFGFEQLAAHPSTNNFAGRIYENTTDGLLYKRNSANTAYVAVGPATAYEPIIAVGTTAQYWRGDKTWQTLDKSAVGLSNVDNTSDANKPVSSATQLALNAKYDISNPAGYQTAAQVSSSITAAVTGLFDDRGNYDASVNTFPTTGGSGAAGAVLKGDVWRITVAGTLGGIAYKIGDTIRALVDAPGQTAANWAGAENNVDVATISTLGLVQLASVVESDARTDASKAITPATLVNTPLQKEFTFGDGTASSFVLTHSLNTRKVQVSFYDTATFEEWHFGFSRSSVNAITVTPAFVPTAGQFVAVIVGRLNA